MTKQYARYCEICDIYGWTPVDYSKFVSTHDLPKGGVK